MLLFLVGRLKPAGQTQSLSPSIHQLAIGFRTWIAGLNKSQQIIADHPVTSRDEGNAISGSFHVDAQNFAKAQLMLTFASMIDCGANARMEGARAYIASCNCRSLLFRCSALRTGYCRLIQSSIRIATGIDRNCRPSPFPS